MLTVRLSLFISVINQLDVRNFCFTISLFHVSTCFEHMCFIIRRSKLHYTASSIIRHIGVMFRAHVLIIRRSKLHYTASGIIRHVGVMFRAHVLIIRRSKLHYTASGIITPIGGRLVHRLREDCSPL